MALSTSAELSWEPGTTSQGGRFRRTLRARLCWISGQGRGAAGPWDEMSRRIPVRGVTRSTGPGRASDRTLQQDSSPFPPGPSQPQACSWLATAGPFLSTAGPRGRVRVAGYPGASPRPPSAQAPVLTHPHSRVPAGRR